MMEPMTPEEHADMHSRFGELLADNPGLDMMILEFERARKADMKKAALQRPFITSGIRMMSGGFRPLEAANDARASAP
jgi:hypothetical protein